METKYLQFVCLIGILSIVSCTTYQTLPSSKQPVPRIIILDGSDTLSQKYAASLISWDCKEYFDGDRTLVEVGYFDNPSFKDIGIILYDGGNKGETTFYGRTGLDQRWDWNTNGGSYSFIISPDGKGLYYDFTSIPSGETTKAKAVYKCKQK